MRLHGVLGSIGFVLLLGACEVHVANEPAPAYRPPPPAPPPQQRVAVVAPPPARPAPPPPAPVRPGPPGPIAVAPPRPFVRPPARIVHPIALQNPGAPHLNLVALRARLRPNRKCGPRESTPGHWIHIDCNQYSPIAAAKKFSPRKIRLLVAGALRLDSAVGHPGATTDAAGKVSAAQLPDGVDHRTDGTEGPIKDQGQVGSCTSFSLSSAMDNGIRRQNKPDVTSSLHIWSHYAYPDMQRAGEGTVGKPIAAWDAWPYDERTACELDTSGDGDCGPYTPAVVEGSGGSDAVVQAKIKDSDSKGHWKVTEYDEIPGDPDTIAAVLSGGSDVWFSMRIGETWMHPNGDTIPDWTDAQVEGGHAVLFAGYRHTNGQRQFLVHNSWGKDWADQGYAWISETALKQYIKHAYKVVVADASAPAPAPGDPNALTDDDCGEDQLVDSASGQCATICPDDTRPANGQCH